MGDSNPPATFGHVVRELSKRKLAFIMARESATGTPRIGPELRRQFSGAWVANEGFTPETGAMGLEEGVADAVSFGKLFISNPDLPERVRRGLPLAPWNDRTFYAEGPVGYTDYPRAT
jgi:2,4-dienoyl-CoA reductase-like NADH-dependent reductase (Old Yellow Enzyme family)